MISNILKSQIEFPKTGSCAYVAILKFSGLYSQEFWERLNVENYIGFFHEQNTLSVCVCFISKIA